MYVIMVLWQGFMNTVAIITKYYTTAAVAGLFSHIPVEVICKGTLSKECISILVVTSSVKDPAFYSYLTVCL